MLNKCLMKPLYSNLKQMASISKSDIQKLRVSSVMRNEKSFGKENIFDENEDTCWSSHEGSPQWIWLEFKEPKTISSFSIQFQGGFVGQNCRVELINGQKVTSEPFYPEDVNSNQRFSTSEPVTCKQIKFVFEGSTDFFGRIVVYSINF